MRSIVVITGIAISGFVIAMGCNVPTQSSSPITPQPARSNHTTGATQTPITETFVETPRITKQPTASPPTITPNSQGVSNEPILTPTATHGSETSNDAMLTIPSPEPIPTTTPNPIPNSSTAPTPDNISESQTALQKVAALTWIADGIGGGIEHDAANIFYAESKFRPRTTLAILGKHWINDGISEDELIAVQGIYGLSQGYELPMTEMEGDHENAEMILDMPFLETVTWADAYATSSLFGLYSNHNQQYREILAHPSINHHITDEDAIWISILAPLVANNLSAFQDAMNGNFALQTRVIETPISGRISISIMALGEAQYYAPLQIANLEQSVQFIEEFMGAPLPTKQITLVLEENALNGRGHKAFGYMVLTPEAWLSTVGHETAHYYWYGNRRWIDEGSAQLLGRLVQSPGLDPTAYSGSCSAASTIAELEAIPHERDEIGDFCAYVIGYGLLADLHKHMGRRQFQRQFQRLYQKTLVPRFTDGILDICDLQEAFISDLPEGLVSETENIIRRWYGGPMHCDH